MLLSLCCRVEDLTELRQATMNRAKAADKKVAATAGPAAVTQAYNAKRAELAGADDVRIQLFIRTGQVHNCKLSAHRLQCQMKLQTAPHVDSSKTMWASLM